jgi:cellulose biosynthesis protein BcsQ
MTNPTPTPAGPLVVDVVIHADGAATLNLAGDVRPIVGDTFEDAQRRVAAELAKLAAGVTDRRIPVTITEPRGVFPLWWPAEGRPEDRAPGDLGAPPPPAPRPLRRVPPPPPALEDDDTIPDPEPEPVAVALPEPEPLMTAPRLTRTPDPAPAAVQAPTPAPAPAVPAATGHRPTFDGMRAQIITDAANTLAQDGWRGGLRQLTGWKIGPGPEEQARRDAIRRIQRDTSGPRTVVVANPKGGAGKTPATFLLCLTFAEHLGGYTLFLDNNEGRGTAAWRANQALHALTLTDLIGELDRFETDPSLGIHDLTPYVRAGSMPFDLLAADETADEAMSALGQQGAHASPRRPKLSAEDYLRVRQLARRFYRRIVVDTGNAVDAPNWTAAVANADQLVVPSLVRSDVLLSAAYLLDGLYKAGREDLARNAVVVLTDPTPGGDPDMLAHYTKRLGELTGPDRVFHTPYDRALEGGPIIPDRLSPRTRDVWTQITAAVADGL